MYEFSAVKSLHMKYSHDCDGIIIFAFLGDITARV